MHVGEVLSSLPHGNISYNYENFAACRPKKHGNIGRNQYLLSGDAAGLLGRCPLVFTALQGWRGRHQLPIEQAHMINDIIAAARERRRRSIRLHFQCFSLPSLPCSENRFCHSHSPVSHNMNLCQLICLAVALLFSLRSKDDKVSACCRSSEHTW